MISIYPRSSAIHRQSVADIDIYQVSTTLQEIQPWSEYLTKLLKPVGKVLWKPNHADLPSIDSLLLISTSSKFCQIQIDSMGGTSAWIEGQHLLVQLRDIVLPQDIFGLLQEFEEVLRSKLYVRQICFSVSSWFSSQNGR